MSGRDSPFDAPLAARSLLTGRGGGGAAVGRARRYGGAHEDSDLRADIARRRDDYGAKGREPPAPTHTVRTARAFHRLKSEWTGDAGY